MGLNLSFGGGGFCIEREWVTVDKNNIPTIHYSQECFFTSGGGGIVTQPIDYREPIGGGGGGGGGGGATLPPYISEFYTRKGKTLTDCINQVFAKKVTITDKGGRTYDVKGSNLIKPQTMKNAPKVDDTSWSAFELGGGTRKRALGSYWTGYDTLYLANDIGPIPGTSTQTGKSVTMSANEVKQRTYVHELGNHLADEATKMAVGGPDARYFGDPKGVPHDFDPKADRDFDSGANLEKCMFGNQRP